jgi:hypothetical protein
LNPSHLIKSNVLHNNVPRYCNSDKWCGENNSTVLCPLYASICNKSTSPLCLNGKLQDVRIEQGIPGLKNWQLSSEFNFDR